jgi:hypothetical protein
MKSSPLGDGGTELSAGSSVAFSDASAKPGSSKSTSSRDSSPSPSPVLKSSSVFAHFAMAQTHWRSLTRSTPLRPPSRRCSSWSRLTPWYHESMKDRAYSALARAADSFQMSTRLDTSDIHRRSCLASSGTARPGHRARKTEAIAWHSLDPSSAAGWS